jgi:GT2 family glycosyltransferase
MSKISVNLVVLNGEKYIRHCLDAVLAQTYPHDKIQLNILDNGSTDSTKSIIGNWKLEIGNSSFATFNLIESEQNLGMWPGQEELLKHTNGKYTVALCVDVMLDKNFAKNAVETLEKDDKIGALQPKIYKYDASTDFQNSKFIIPNLKIIDTAGFQVFKSRRIVNIGHGEEDKEQYDNLGEIFAVEGAVPVFRKEALLSCKIMGEIADHDFFWYGDDLDLAWRMRLFGWKQVFAPNVIAWHDRQTTKTLKKSWLDYLMRVPIRRQIPIRKRRLDWRNLRWTLVKNDYIINILKDLPWIVSREIAVLGYTILFEPEVLKEIPAFFRYLPNMFRKRKEIMKKAVLSPKEIRKWIYG